MPVASAALLLSAVLLVSVVCRGEGTGDCQDDAVGGAASAPDPEPQAESPADAAMSRPAAAVARRLLRPPVMGAVSGIMGGVTPQCSPCARNQAWFPLRRRTTYAPAPAAARTSPPARATEPRPDP